MRKQLVDLGQEPPPMSDCPADFEDFPQIVHTSFDIFNLLPDEYIPKMEGAPFYKGKDLSVLPMLFKLHFVDSAEDQLMVLDFISMLDIKAKKDLNKRTK